MEMIQEDSTIHKNKSSYFISLNRGKKHSFDLKNLHQLLLNLNLGEYFFWIFKESEHHYEFLGVKPSTMYRLATTWLSY